MKKAIIFAATALIGTTLFGCGSSSTPEDTIVVGASPTPHALILEQAREDIESKGYKLTIREFSDYVLPNTALQAGDIDANYFQHLPYLLDFNEKNNTDLVSAGAIHFEPYGIYAGKKSSLSDIASGDTIAIPNDTTNRGRALLLLNQCGLITLKTTDKGFDTGIGDIEDNKGLQITQMEAATIPSVLADVAFGVVNGNYALGANITDKVLATESTDSLAANQNANIIAVKRENENSEKTKVLIEALTTEKIKNYINTTFGSTVIPVFE